MPTIGLSVVNIVCINLSCDLCKALTCFHEGKISETCLFNKVLKKIRLSVTIKGDKDTFCQIGQVEEK